MRIGSLGSSAVAGWGVVFPGECAFTSSLVTCLQVTYLFKVFPVITVEKLRIYQRYKGDLDGFSRRRDPLEMSIITDDDWIMIDILSQRLFLEQSVPCAESFRADTQRLLSEQVSDAVTAAQLKELAFPNTRKV